MPRMQGALTGVSAIRWNELPGQVRGWCRRYRTLSCLPAIIGTGRFRRAELRFQGTTAFSADDELAVRAIQANLAARLRQLFDLRVSDHDVSPSGEDIPELIVGFSFGDSLHAS